ncbi:hypothetical protein MHU86_15151 [Fragilaria crotonensis]|nr:hypothetical protein MHU86_15151 [Fragilaria crotonensis]
MTGFLTTKRYRYATVYVDQFSRLGFIYLQKTASAEETVEGGCPTYVLTNELQSNRPFHKWSQRSRAGVYLGRSPQHGRNVALVMDRDTALVSPQFHVAYDATFDTVKNVKTKSSWQLRAGFVTSQKELTTKGATSPSSQTTSMTSSSRKRKRHTPNERARAGEPVPSSQKEPAAANVGDDGPPIPIDATETGDRTMGDANRIQRRDSGARSSHLRNISRRCARRSATPLGTMSKEKYFATWQCSQTTTDGLIATR